MLAEEPPRSFHTGLSTRETDTVTRGIDHELSEADSSMGLWGHTVMCVS